MMPILLLVIFMFLSAVLGGERWKSRTNKYVLIAAVALTQTLLLLLAMYTMNMPKGSYLP
jgi:hypothetical protein